MVVVAAVVVVAVVVVVVEDGWALLELKGRLAEIGGLRKHHGTAASATGRTSAESGAGAGARGKQGRR